MASADERPSSAAMGRPRARVGLREVVDGILSPFVLLEAVRDEDSSIVDSVSTEANQAACHYSKVAYDDLVGARLMELLPGHARSGLLSQYAQGGLRNAIAMQY